MNIEYENKATVVHNDVILTNDYLQSSNKKPSCKRRRKTASFLEIGYWSLGMDAQRMVKRL